MKSGQLGVGVLVEGPLDQLDQLGIGGDAILVVANPAVGKKLAAIAHIGLILIGPLDRKFIGS
jgi:hypothetical protein